MRRCPPVPSALLGTLIGKIGSGSYFVVGSDDSFTAGPGENGELYLLYNDVPGYYGDNTGSYTASITVTSQPAVSIHPRVGPPTTRVSVSGSGFGGQEAVDIYFGTRDKALAVTDSNGSFSGRRIRVPASATPGNHWITLVGRRTGRAAQTRFLVRTDWAQFRFSASHSGYNPFENVLGPSNVAGLGLAWSYTTINAVESSPAVAGGVVYVGCEEGECALDASTGHKLWYYTTGDVVFSSPAVAGGVVYVGSLDGNVYALDASTGRKLWSYTTGGEVDSSPAVAGGVVYVASYGNGKVYALDASSGKELWSYTTGGEVDSSPAVAGGVVYVGSLDGKVYALDASSGKELWSFTTGLIDRSSPAVANGVVYVGSTNNNVYALNAATGHRLWSYNTGERVLSSPAVANGVVYIGSTNNNVYALDASTGHKLWTYTTGGAVLSSPAVANGVVYIGSTNLGSTNNNVYALDATTGKKLWSVLTSVYNPPVFVSSSAVANGVVYVGALDGKVYAFDLAANLINQAARPKPSQLKPNRSLRASN